MQSHMRFLVKVYRVLQGKVLATLTGGEVHSQPIDKLKNSHFGHSIEHRQLERSSNIIAKAVIPQDTPCQPQPVQCLRRYRW